MGDTTTIVQWNANGLAAHARELKNFVASAANPPEVLCIQETFLKTEKQFVFHGYNVVRKDRTGALKRGVATLIRDGLRYQIIESPPEVECVIIKISTKRAKITIMNVYNPPDKEIDKEIFKKLFSFKNVIITGDLNAKSPLWGHEKLNARGSVIEQLLDEHDVVMLNTGQPTYQKPQGGMSALDITMASTSLALKCNWWTLNDPMGSDHIPTVTKINDKAVEETGGPTKWMLGKADWKQFKNNCQQINSTEIEHKNIEMFAQNFVNAITKAADASIPKTKTKTNQKTQSLPYWSEACTEAIKQRNKVRNKMNVTRKEEDCDEYKRLKGVAQKTLKVAASEHWHKFCSNMNDCTRLGSVWRMSKSMAGSRASRTIPNLIRNNLVCEGNETKANMLAETFAEASSDKNYTTAFLQHKTEVEQNQKITFTDDSSPERRESPLNEEFNLHELKNAIKQVKKISPGRRHDSV